MTSKRETVLAALYTSLRAALTLNFTEVLRGDGLPEDVPDRGLVILRDGTPGAPEVTLSPLAYHYQHRADVELFVAGRDGRRDSDFDTLATRVGAVLIADRTLGGLCDWVEAEAPEPSDLPVEGAETIKAAVIAVTLHYSTSDPLT